jgi:hypothetical protein
LTGVFFLWAALSVQAQEPDNLNKALILIRPYEPSVVDAQKINTLPDLKDTSRIAPVFQYSIKSRRMDTYPDIVPITVAKLQPLPQTKLYHAYIKAGIGTKVNPLVEVALNTLRGNQYAMGAMFKYDASYANLVLDNRQQVYAGYSDSEVKLFGQKFFRSSYLYGDLGVSGQTVYNYGYRPSMDTTLLRDDIRKHYTFVDARVGIRSSHFKTDELNYNVRATYHRAGNKANTYGDGELMPSVRKFNENAVQLDAQLDNNMFGGNVDLEFFTRSEAFDTLQNNFAMGINPWFIMDNDSIRLEVGMRVSVYQEGEGILQYKIYPKVEFQFTLLKDMFIPFVGIDGNLRTNTYRSLIRENPFITPGLAIPITNAKLNIYAGLKGAITKKLSYYLRVGFTTTDDEYFFVNDTVRSNIHNYFTAITDDMNTFSFRGEIFYNPIERLSLRLKTNYNRYEPSKEKYAWHKPGLEMEFSTVYTLQDKLSFTLDVFGLGKRYAKAFEPDVDYYTLGSTFDFNIGVEYRYMKVLSFFLKLNNLTGSQYYRWNYYPSQRFNAMVGFTYSL